MVHNKVMVATRRQRRQQLETEDGILKEEVVKTSRLNQACTTIDAALRKLNSNKNIGFLFTARLPSGQTLGLTLMELMAQQLDAKKTH